MPWRGCDNAYYIWVSEVMLQQTQVDQVKPYFEHFTKKFPTVYDLAEADQQAVLKVWEGLGYYSRARHLHHAAKTVVEEFDGAVPSTWDEIISLKGVGPYTASAVLSIAYDKPYAVLDGNVTRTLSRLYGIDKNVRDTSTKNTIQEYADELLDKEHPGRFNQALMELGALVCTPSEPDCGACPFQSDCIAYKTLKTDEIPYKSAAKKKPHHNIAVGIIVNEGQQVLIAHRPEDAMLGGLWEFPGGKQEDGESLKEAAARELKEELGVDVQINQDFMTLKHTYSHFKITLHAFLCEMSGGKPKPNTSQQIKWVDIKQLEEYPFPKANRRLTDKLVEWVE